MLLHITIFLFSKRCHWSQSYIFAYSNHVLWEICEGSPTATAVSNLVRSQLQCSQSFVEHTANRVLNFKTDKFYNNTVAKGRHTGTTSIRAPDFPFTYKLRSIFLSGRRRRFLIPITNISAQIRLRNNGFRAKEVRYVSSFAPST